VEWRGSHFLKVRKKQKRTEEKHFCLAEKMCLLIRH